MKRTSGLVLSEVVSFILVIVIVSAVGFGYFVSSQRKAMVANAELTLEAITAQADKRIASGKNIPCESSQISAEILENEFLELSVETVLVDTSKSDSGYTLALYVQSNQVKDGNDSFVTAELLHDAIKAKDESTLRVIQKTDTDIEYFILSSDRESCESEA